MMNTDPLLPDSMSPQMDSQTDIHREPTTIRQNTVISTNTIPEEIFFSDSSMGTSNRHSCSIQQCSDIDSDSTAPSAASSTSLSHQLSLDTLKAKQLESQLLIAHSQNIAAQSKLSTMQTQLTQCHESLLAVQLEQSFSSFDLILHKNLSAYYASALAEALQHLRNTIGELTMLREAQAETYTKMMILQTELNEIRIAEANWN
jgi:hypothetical protein